MTKVLFVCTGNICRSPMDEAIMRHHLRAQGLADQIEVDSAGVISYHAGEKIDARAFQELVSHGIEYHGRSRQVGPKDFYNFDYIIAMTRAHLRELEMIRPKDARAQVGLFSQLVELPVEEIEDPYYANNFPQVYQQLEQGAIGLIEKLDKNLAFKK